MAAICLAAAGDCPDALAPAGDDDLGIGGITTPGTTHLTTQAPNHFATLGSTLVGTVGARRLTSLFCSLRKAFSEVYHAQVL